MSTRISNAARAAPGGLVDIVSGSFGAGHDAAASAIADRLQARGFRTRTWDVVDLMPGRLGRAVRSGYLRQVQSAPASWRWLLHAVERREGVAAGIGRALETTEGGLLEIAADGPDAIVSTHPFASQALGHLRSIGRLEAPVTTYLTDMSVHRLWVHPGVDEHLAVHALPAQEALALGARSATVVEPAVSTAFGRVARDRLTRGHGRRAFALPRGERLALITGGSCGIGRLFESARDVAATGVATPVVLCGTNARLLARVHRRPDMVGLGWVEDMPALVSAVSVVIQNAGGITSLETAAAGVPMVTYRCIAGHGETNAAALDAAGIAPWVRDQDRLGVALLRALHAKPIGRCARLDLPDVVDTLFPTPALIA
jgi:UDP-N-acetylglucosamine:LPS N-acetylglucosamine transferase